MAAIIGQDPVLTGNLLRIANSPAYKVHERPVESLQRAVTLVGTEGVRQIISAVLVQPVMQVQCECSRSSARSSGSTHCWHRVRGRPRTHGHLRRCLRRAVAGPGAGLGAALVMRQLLQEAQARGEPVEPALALQLLQQWSLPLAQRVAAAWELPEPVHQALAVDAEGPLADSLRLASAAAAASLLCRHGHASQSRMLALLEQLPSAPPHALRWIWRRLHGRNVETLDEAGQDGPLRRPERYSCDSTGSQLITRDNQRLRAVAPGSASTQCGGGSRSSQRNRRRSSSASHQLCLGSARRRYSSRSCVPSTGSSNSTPISVFR